MSILCSIRFATVLSMALALSAPVFPQHPEKLNDPGPERTPEGNRKWGVKPIYHSMRRWLFPYVQSRALPGDFHSITYLFVDYKCRLPRGMAC